ALLDLLDAQSVEAEELSVHTPDLDDVFLALTGRPRPSTDTATEKAVTR
ncbi:ABC transporter, partial [Streptomyces niveus]